MYRIVNVKAYSEGLEKAAQYIHGKWGSKDNYMFYLDAISNSSCGDALPRFYLLLKDLEIVGCYALLVNDFVSRQDLMPWFGCLFIEEHERGKRLSEKLFSHSRIEAKKAGYDTISLTTDHDGLYEKFGWRRIEDGYDVAGKRSRIYAISIS